ncbi:MAG: virulence-associated E family protein [Bacteroidaceae bacterium]|nr:virulence-associated E family protein [Bacteroidaceae bacterium]
MQIQKQLNNSAEVICLVESFLLENYAFRRNVLSGKIEYRGIAETDNQQQWGIVTVEVMNSIVRKAKKAGISKNSPRTDIEEYINSDAVSDFDPIQDYLEHLPAWDGKNHVANLFNRIPGLTSEQLAWCSTWLRSAVVHWLGLEELHGNECTPILIGRQGCGKTTFAYKLLPPQLRMYFLDHINFANKFDQEMALTHNLLVNIDEFANMKGSQQGKLKQTLSKQKVNGRPIFGKAQADRRRYASFLATTNDEHPLCDPTGSRRYLCLRVPHKMLIDNVPTIDYEQLYAQVMYEIKEMKTPHWFTIAEEDRIQQLNQIFMKEESLENMLGYFYKVPEVSETGEWLLMGQIIGSMQEAYPKLTDDRSTRVKIGQALRMLGCQTKETRQGMKYQLIEKQAA